MKESKKPKDNILASDLEALKESHRFVRDDSYDEQHCDDWRVRMARRYYNKLYKEYGIIDLSRYKEGKYGIRWRTEAEVVTKKGQSVCASKDCNGTDALKTYELPFKYVEDSEVKRELVKICLCPTCDIKLQYVRESSKGERSSKKRTSDIEGEPVEKSQKKHPKS